MDQKAFVVLNAIIILLVMMFFLRSRKKEGPTRLNLSSRGRLPESSVPGPSPGERSINVIFQHNGHSWDAFEVLGIPAGSSKGEAEVAFDRMVKTADADSKKFFKAALDAIRAS